MTPHETAERPQFLPGSAKPPLDSAAADLAGRSPSGDAGEVSLAANVGNWCTSLLRQIATVLWHLGWHLFVFATWCLPGLWDGKHYFWLARNCWAPGLLKIGDARATFVGRDRVDWTQPHVIVANHQGNADIPLLFMTLPTPLRLLAKRSVAYIPVLGWMLALARFPFIDRESARKSRASIDAVARRIREEKLNVAVFPEGTRTPEGTMLPFKSGAFLLAIKAQVPIVPVAISGSGTSLARGSFRIYPTPITVTVCDPIPTEGMTVRDRDELAAKAQQAILDVLGWRRIEEHEMESARRADEQRRFRTLAAPRS